MHSRRGSGISHGSDDDLPLHPRETHVRHDARNPRAGRQPSQRRAHLRRIRVHPCRRGISREKPVALHDGRTAGARVARIMPDVRLAWVEGKIVVTAVGDSAAAAGVHRGDVNSRRGWETRNGCTCGGERTSVGRHTTVGAQRALGRMLSGAPGTATVLRVTSTDNGATKELRLARTTLTTPHRDCRRR